MGAQGNEEDRGKETREQVRLAEENDSGPAKVKATRDAKENDGRLTKENNSRSRLAKEKEARDAKAKQDWIDEIESGLKSCYKRFDAVMADIAEGLAEAHFLEQKTKVDVDVRGFFASIEACEEKHGRIRRFSIDLGKLDQMVGQLTSQHSLTQERTRQEREQTQIAEAEEHAARLEVEQAICRTMKRIGDEPEVKTHAAKRQKAERQMALVEVFGAVDFVDLAVQVTAADRVSTAAARIADL